MTMPIEERLDKAWELRRANRHQEVLEIVREIIATDPTNADAWWLTGLARHSLGRIEESIAALRETLKHAPGFASGWAQYGLVLGEAGRIEEAKKALAQALRIDARHVFARRQLARICKETKDYDGQIQHLTALDALGQVDSYDLNLLGIAHWEKRHFSRAIEYYSRSAAAEPSYAPYFNLALVYSDREVSQDVDAVDSLHRALRLKPDHTPARKMLSELTSRLEDLAKESRKTGETLLYLDEYFQFYMNPFELLGAKFNERFEKFDQKTVQRLKRRLLQEMELEDGAIERLDGFILDRSRAIGLCDELHDDNLREYHWLVFRNPLLLWFLTRGDVRHFLYRPGDYITIQDSSEEQGYDVEGGILGLLEELDSEWSGFREWLSEPFARQYNLVLSRALERRTLPLIESLFDGRRWVLRAHEDICFSGAHRHVDRLLEPLQALAKSAKTKMPLLADIQKLLSEKSTLAVLNLLPEPFRDQQVEAVRAIRDIAIAAYNQHNDIDLSKAVLALSNNFSFKSAELTQRLEADFQQIQKLIAEERKHEAKLTLGDRPMEITKEGVRKGSTFMGANVISTVRWGILITGYQHAPTYEFLMAFRDDFEAGELAFSWRSSNNLAKQEELFGLLVDAALNFVVPNVMSKIRTQLEQGKRVRIGNCVLTQDAVSFEMKSWLRTKMHTVPWRRVGTEARSGMLTVYDQAAPKTRTAMVLRNTENGIILQLVAAVKRNEDT
ncbi:MAG: tetratricopeptide repeat protein [Candidatus Udaeobacter sp.]